MSIWHGAWKWEGWACPKEVRMPRWFSSSVHIGWVAVVLGGAALSGCGSNDEQMVCDENGCEICDAYGCRPANPGTGGSGGATASGGSGGSSGSAASAGSAGSAGSGGEPDGGTVCDPSTTTCPCGPGDVCEGDLQCIEGLCLVPCEFSSECGGNRICVNGKCVVGCDLTVACPEGYTCGDNGACELDPDDPACSDASPCPGGLQCVEGVCQGGCDTNDDCAPTEICNATTGTCIEDPQPSRPCENDASVCGATQVCKDGYCRYPCTDGDSCKLIDARIPVCQGGICMSETEANPECTKQEDCAPGLDCVSNECK